MGRNAKHSCSAGDGPQPGSGSGQVWNSNQPDTNSDSTRSGSQSTTRILGLIATLPSITTPSLSPREWLPVPEVDWYCYCNPWWRRGMPDPLSTRKILHTCLSPRTRRSPRRNFSLFRSPAPQATATRQVISLSRRPRSPQARPNPVTYQFAATRAWLTPPYHGCCTSGFTAYSP
jgi:hypothetical protein